MADVWSDEQIRSLAPDPASAQAGFELANSGRFARMGKATNAIWGECLGSGKKPYQIKIDLGEPAYACSCPSRKFPCKHALGLLMIWSRNPSSVIAEDPPDWVSSWLESRANRAEKKALAAKDALNQEATKFRLEVDSGSKVDRVESTAKKKRDAARNASVVAGLDELDVWLADLARRGLGTLPNETKSVWDERARRMIDSKAPGVARRLRLIECIPLTGENWSVYLLDRLAELHAIAEGFRRIDSLPPPVQDDLRAVVGVTVDQGSLRSGAGVRDLWSVVGRSVEIDDRLRTRRTWLVGRSTNQPALVLDFAFGAAAFPPPLPVGAAVDGELVFFPGSVPLRAIMKEGVQSITADPDPFPGVRSIDRALLGYAGALGLNPWIELYPFVLNHITLIRINGSWFARDEAGAIVPICGSFQHGWGLLGLTGGRPFDLAAEFDGETLEPLACRFEGAVRSLARDDYPPRGAGSPAFVAPADSARTFLELAASALVGVERKPPPKPPRFVAESIKGFDEHNKTKYLYDLAFTTSITAKIGRKPPLDPNPPEPPCEPDAIPPCGRDAARRLLDMIAGNQDIYIKEWLQILKRSGKRVLEGAVAPLLARGVKNKQLQPDIREAIGERGRWLAARNPDWSYAVVSRSGESDCDEKWRTGSRDERIAALEALHESEPARALELLQSTWKTESADDRARFVAALRTGLSMSDEPFLESTLDDRSANVRREAAGLLARLVESRYCGRMIERLKPLVSWSWGKLKLELPGAIEPSMFRDGLGETPEGKANRAAAIGDRSGLLQAIVAVCPIGFWTEKFEVEAAKIVRAGLKSEHADALRRGWCASAARAADLAWAEALLIEFHSHDYNLYDLNQYAELLGVLSPSKRDAYLCERLNRDAGPLRSDRFSFKLIERFARPIGLEPARLIHDKFKFSIDDVSMRDPKRFDHALAAFIPELAAIVPVELFDEIEIGEAAMMRTFGYSYEESYRKFIERLAFRRAMYKELM